MSDEPAAAFLRRWRPGPLLPAGDARDGALAFVIAVLCFFACLTALAALAGDRAARGWTAQLQDSATVLVAGSFTNSYKNKKGKVVDDEPAPFRVAVSVVKIGGKWIVDDFTPVTGVSDDGTGGTGGATPSTPATDGVSPSSPASSQGGGQ